MCWGPSCPGHTRHDAPLTDLLDCHLGAGWPAPRGAGAPGLDAAAFFALQPSAPEPLAHAEDAAWHAVVPGIGRRVAGLPAMDAGGGGLLSTLVDVVACGRLVAHGGVLAGRRLLSARLFVELARNQLPPGLDGPAGYCGSGFGFGLGVAVRLDWGPAAMACSTGELTA